MALTAAHLNAGVILVCGHCLVTLSITINETSKWLSQPPILMQGSFWWWQCSDRCMLPPPPPPPPSLISLMVSVDVKHHLYLLKVSYVCAYDRKWFSESCFWSRHRAGTVPYGVNIQVTVGNSWDILNAILGHKYHQNLSNRVVSSECSQHLQQKWLWLQSVNGWVLVYMSKRSTVLSASAIRKHA